MAKKKKTLVVWLSDVGIGDVPIVGGKNASLGEMLSALKKKQILVPDGFATTSDAFFHFLQENQLQKPIRELLKSHSKGKIPLSECGRTIRSLILQSKMPEDLYEEIASFYQKLSQKLHVKHADVAVRSSATAEDLPTASFAGQQETFLHITTLPSLIKACIRCFASLYTDRAIIYRREKGFENKKIALSICIQQMIRADLASSGVMFTLDPETGFNQVVCIDGSWGLGENVVQGSVIPDEFVVFKPHLNQKKGYPILEKTMGSKLKKLIYTKDKKTVNRSATQKEQNTFVLTNDEIIALAKAAVTIEKHFKKAMDIEWAKDGLTNQLFIVQARPETVQSQKKALFTSYKLKSKSKLLCEGLAIGSAIANGPVQVIQNVSQIESFKEGSILVTRMTSPDWVPIMKQAKGIITDQGGRTSHAAIVSRELGIPAIVGTKEGTKKLRTIKEATISCAEGDMGKVYEGICPYEEKSISLDFPKKLPANIMLNIGSPQEAFRWWRLPAKGVGLARMEFIISNLIRIHPMALVYFDQIKDKKIRSQIEKLTKKYDVKSDYFITELSRNIAKIAASQYPHPVIVRMSDFKTNEYADLIGGSLFEKEEDNPMLGFRGASRYYDKRYEEGFQLECQAIKLVREFWGFTNVIIMIPFCRTLEEADLILKVLANNGLKKGQKGLQIYMMAEIPSNVILAEAFAEKFDGFSIGSNDLTQLILGIDRDASLLSHLFDEKNPAVLSAISDLIKKAHKKKIKVGICGEAPSTYPEFAQFLIDQKIDSISLSPTSVMGILKYLIKKT
jgi:pyruvate, water dikinase